RRSDWEWLASGRRLTKRDLPSCNLTIGQLLERQGVSHLKPPDHGLGTIVPDVRDTQRGDLCQAELLIDPQVLSRIKNDRARRCAGPRRCGTGLQTRPIFAANGRVWRPVLHDRHHFFASPLAFAGSPLCIESRTFLVI